MIIRTIFITQKRNAKIVSIVAYSITMELQFIYCGEVLYAEHKTTLGLYICKFFALFLVVLPFVIENILFIYRNVSLSYYPAQDASILSFADLKENVGKIKDTIQKVKEKITSENIGTILQDIPRHNSFEYVNNGSLTNAYFDYAYKTLDIPYVYIVISNTGNAASEFISIFTNKQYNHTSLAFERDLKTIVSYNGGERVYPPGLNPEMLENFNKKSDASIIVYKLKCTVEQKRMIVDKIKTINQEGNAYNLMGLLLKYSHKPNIMFCSQFVYKMLEYAGLNYFEKNDTDVKPMDLIELDYQRKLEYEYEYEIKFNEIIGGEHK
jgi:hypothetical protein